MANIAAFFVALAEILKKAGQLLIKPTIDRKSERKASVDDRMAESKITGRPDPDDWRGR